MTINDASGLLTDQILAVGGFAKTVLEAYVPALFIVLCAVVAISLARRYLGAVSRA